MATASELRSLIVQLSDNAERDLALLWAQLDATTVRDGLMDVLPALVDQYGDASAAVTAEWYDEYRADLNVRGTYAANLASPDLGAQALAGWGSQLAQINWDTALAQITGGLIKRVMNASRDTMTSATYDDPQARGWQRQGRGECSFCRLLIGRGAVYTRKSVNFGAHDNCFPAGVLVTGPSVERGFRRRYEGELVVISFAGGKELPVTPNHPVLTPRGWVPAGELRVGEDVFERAGADLASLNVPHENEIPSRIEDVWGAARMNVFRSVPVSPKDFHGDAGLRKGNVDVVAPDRLLAEVWRFSGVEQRAQTVGAGVAFVLNPLTTLGNGFLPRIGALGTADGLMGRSRQGGSLCRRHALQTQCVRLARGSHLKPSVGEPPVNDAPRHFALGRDQEHAVATRITLGEIGRGVNATHPGNGMVARSGDDSSTEQGFSDALTGLTPQNASNLVERLSGGVKPLRIVDLVRREARGHVYNLQTAEGWYSANGVIVHNCKCVAVPAFGGRPVPVKPYQVTDRAISDADRARVRDWIAQNQ